MPTSPRDDNKIAGLIAKSDADNTPVVIESDPITKRLKVNATITGPVATTGGLTDTEMRATAVPVSGTFYPATQPVSATDLDIRNLIFATDKVDVSGSTITLVSGTALTTYAVRITTNTTTTPVATTAYISSIVVSSEVAGTTSTLTIQDKSATPKKLINGFTTVAVTTTPTVINFQTPILMTSGLDIITAGVAAATLDIWINYYA